MAEWKFLTQNKEQNFSDQHLRPHPDFNFSIVGESKDSNISWR